MSTSQQRLGTTCRTAVAVVATAALGVAALAAPAASSRPGDLARAGDSLGMIAYDAHSRVTGHREVFTVRSDGSERHRVTGHGGSDPSWSPDGSRIVYLDEQGLWVVDADGTDDHLLVAAAPGDPLLEPAWSPDGSEVAFSRNEALVVVDTTTGDQRILVTPTRRWWSAYGASWSPDGTALVFSRTRHAFDFFAASQLFTVPADGGAVTPLLSTAPGAQAPDWSPDGDRIYYSQVSLRGDLHWSADVYGVAPDGTGNALVSSAGMSDIGVSVSGDGQRLAVAGTDDDPAVPDLTDLDGIWTMATDGGGRELVVRGTARDPDWRPGYAGDPNPVTVPLPGPGPALVVVTAGPGGTDLVRIDPDGSDPLVLTGSGRAWDPSWSPDHGRIAYVDGSVLRLVRADGTGDHAVHVRVRPNGHLAWSPDGRRIAWGTDDGIVVLTLPTGAMRFLPLTVAGDLAWRPDNRAIAVGEVRGGPDVGLRLVRPDGTGVRVVSHARGVETRPSWSADWGTLTWTVSDRSDRTRIVGLRVDDRLVGHDRRTVWQTPGLDTAPVWEPAGDRLALFSDGPAPYGSAPAPGVWVTTPAPFAAARPGSLVTEGEPGLALLDRSVSDLDW